ncbi:hypothetical protein EDD36DRAFT_439343 [Exophiala viscosa]|uniref:Uncharacterized protein n=1 Tax=Exophiala viscosa TaxID=2486360 RepID=A0AAN6IDG5_9EURO|nr:hypothetical protein EDD36DRAFT_439343 [Exophiala viscosa]
MRIGAWPCSICTLRPWGSNPAWVWVTLPPLSFWVLAFRVSVALANRRQVHYHGPYQGSHLQRARAPTIRTHLCGASFVRTFKLPILSTFLRSTHTPG